jgi:hypothetical protein
MQKVDLYSSWFLVVGTLYKGGSELYDGDYHEFASTALVFAIFVTWLRDARKRVAAENMAVARTEGNA